MNNKPAYWFPAKKYGWGWGSPATWQGWLVLGIFFALLGLGFVWLPPGRSAAAFLAYTGVLCAGLLGVCLAKGEPPAWRWGEKKR
jgi:hypothetical protein